MPFFHSIPHIVHAAVIRYCDDEEIECYIGTGIELLQNPEVNDSFFEEPFYFASLRYRCMRAGSLSWSVWPKFCHALLLKRGREVLPVFVQNKVISECLVALEGESIRLFYFHMIALLWEIRIADAGESPIDSVEPIISVLQDERFGAIIEELVNQPDAANWEISPDITIDLHPIAVTLMQTLPC